MDKCFRWWKGKALASIASVVLVASVIGCSQSAAPTPTVAPTAVPAKETGDSKEAKPVAKETKETKPAATAAKSETKPAAKEDKKLTKMTVAYVALAGTMTPLWIAKEQGLFEKYGLEVDMPFISSGTVGTNAMISGEITMALGGEGIINVDLGGADLVYIGTVQDAMAYIFFGQPDIQRIEDLKGKTVGITRFGSTADVAARMALRKYGLEPDKDVAIVQMGGTSETLGGMKAGAIQGTVTMPPNSVTLKKLGMRELVNISELGIPYPSGTMPISKKYLNANREAVTNFMKAFVEAIAVAKKDRDYTMKVIGQYTKTDDKDVLGETYDYIIAKVMRRVPSISEAAVQALLNVVAATDPRAKDMKPSAYIDSSILKEIEDSGFVKKLYGE